MRLLSEREQIEVVNDQIGTPTFAGDLAKDETGEEGLIVRGLMRSPLIGPKGNVEFLAWLECAGEQTASIEKLVNAAVPIELEGSESSTLSSGS